MLKLYELSQMYSDFVDAVDRGEISDEKVIEDTLDSIKQPFDEKCESIALLCKNLTAESECIRSEAKKLIDRAQRKERLCERLKNYISVNLQSIGQEKLETAKCQLSFRRSESVQIYDEERLFESCSNSGIEGLARKSEVLSFDKKAIKDAIKSGTELAGASVVTNKNLQIK